MTLISLRALCEGAAKGKWRCHKAKVWYHVKDERNFYIAQNISLESDAAFIAASRTYLPLLIAVAEAVRESIENCECRRQNITPGCCRCETFRALLRRLEEG